MITQTVYLITQKRFMSAHKEHFFVVFSIVLPLMLGYTTAADRGERDSHSMFNNWKSDPPMSTQKTFVSAHKKNFDLYDCS